MAVKEAAVGIYSRTASSDTVSNTSGLRSKNQSTVSGSNGSSAVYLGGATLFSSGHSTMAVTTAAATSRKTAAMMKIYLTRFFSVTLGSCCSSKAEPPPSYSLPNNITMLFLGLSLLSLRRMLDPVGFLERAGERGVIPPTSNYSTHAALATRKPCLPQQTR